VHELGLDVFVWSADSTNTWCYQQPGGPRVSADRRLFLGPPARATPRATRHAPRATRHAPRTLPPNFLWAAPATTQRQEHGRASRQEQRQEHRKHRAKSDTHPKASRQEHGRRSHEDNATSASRPGRARSSPALLRQQAPSAAGNRQQAPSTAGSIDSRLHRQQAPSASGRPARRRHVQVPPSVPPAAWAHVFWARRWLRLVAAPGGCAWWLRLVAAPVAPTGLVSVSTRGPLRSGAACKGATRATVRAA